MRFPQDVREANPDFALLEDSPDLLEHLPDKQRMNLYRQGAALLSKHSLLSHKPEIRMRREQNDSVWLCLRLNPLTQPMLVGTKPLAAKDLYIFPETDEHSRVPIDILSGAQVRMLEGTTHELAAGVRQFRQAKWDDDEELVVEHSRRLTDTLFVIRNKCTENARSNEFVSSIAVVNR